MLFQEKRTIQYPLKIADAIDLVGELYTTVSINIFEAIHNNYLRANKQNEAEVTYSLWLDNEDYFIDWNWSAKKIKRKIGACGFPFLSAKTFLDNQIISIQEAEIVDDVKIEQRTVEKIFF